MINRLNAGLPITCVRRVGGREFLIPNSEFLIRNWVYLREEDLCSEP